MTPPMGGKETTPDKVTWSQAAFRRAMIAPSEIFWPHSMEVVGSGIEDARELLREGYGLGILLSHFSLRDAEEVLRDVVFAEPVLRDRPVVAPMAAHQYAQTPFLGALASAFGAEITPVINKHSIAYGWAPPERKGEGIATYIDRSAEVLTKGGIVLLAPQAGRKPFLYPIPGRTVEFFVRMMERKNIHSVGYLAVGLGIRGETDYAKNRVGGYNFGRVFEVKVGKTYRQEDLIRQAKEAGTTIDAVVYREFESLVPPSYLGSRGDESP